MSAVKADAEGEAEMLRSTLLRCLISINFLADLQANLFCESLDRDFS